MSEILSLDMRVLRIFDTFSEAARKIGMDDGQFSKLRKAPTQKFLLKLQGIGIDVTGIEPVKKEGKTVIKNSQFGNKGAGEFINDNSGNNEELIKLRYENEFLKKENESLKERIAELKEELLEKKKEIAELKLKQ